MNIERAVNISCQKGKCKLILSCIIICIWLYNNHYDHEMFTIFVIFKNFFSYQFMNITKFVHLLLLRETYLSERRNRKRERLNFSGNCERIEELENSFVQPFKSSVWLYHCTSVVTRTSTSGKHGENGIQRTTKADGRRRRSVPRKTTGANVDRVETAADVHGKQLSPLMKFCTPHYVWYQRGVSMHRERGYWCSARVVSCLVWKEQLRKRRWRGYS